MSFRHVVGVRTGVGRYCGQDSGDMMLAVTQPDTQQESVVVGIQ